MSCINGSGCPTVKELICCFKCSNQPYCEYSCHVNPMHCLYNSYDSEGDEGNDNINHSISNT
jgi:hypothetical protein